MDSARWQQIETLFDAALDLDPSTRESFLDGACDGDADLRAEVAALLAAHEASVAAATLGDPAGRDAIELEWETESADGEPSEPRREAEGDGARPAPWLTWRRALFLSTALAFIALFASLVISVTRYGAAVREERDTRSRADAAESLAYTNTIAAAEAALRLNQVTDAVALLEDIPGPSRGWEWRHLWSRIDRTSYSRPLHRRAVTDVAFTPGGTMFATASRDGTVGLWLTANADSVRRWGPLGAAAVGVAIDPGARLIAAGFADGSVRVWSMANGDSVAALDGKGVPALAFSPDGSRLAVAFAGGAISIWRTDTFKSVATAAVRDSAFCVAYGVDGGRLVAGSTAGHILVLDAQRLKTIQDVPAHDARVTAIALTADGSRLVTASADQTEAVWQLTDKSPPTRVAAFHGHAAAPCDVAFDSTGTRVVSAAADGQIIVWDAATGDRITQLRGGDTSIGVVAASPNGMAIVGGSRDGRVQLWPARAEDIRTLRPPDGAGASAVSDACISPDGRTVASAAGRFEIDLWDAVTGGHIAAIATGRSELVQRLAFGRDGKRLYGGDRGGHIIACDTATRRRLLAFAAHAGSITGIDVSPDGRVLATASVDSVIKLWDARTLAPDGELGRHHGPVSQIAFAHDGSLASASADGTIRIWSIASRDTLRVLRVRDTWVTDIAFHPGAPQLVSVANDGTVALWDTQSGTALATLRTTGDRVAAACFTPDGSRIALGVGSVLQLFDAGTYAEVARLHGEGRRIVGLEPAPAGSALAVSSDGTVAVWDAPPTTPR